MPAHLLCEGDDATDLLLQRSLTTGPKAENKPNGMGNKPSRGTASPYLLCDGDDAVDFQRPRFVTRSKRVSGAETAQACYGSGPTLEPKPMVESRQSYSIVSASAIGNSVVSAPAL